MLKGQFMIIIEFFFKGPSESAPREKIVASLKRVYIDAFRSYCAGDYVTIQQNDQNRRYASRFNVKNR